MMKQQMNRIRALAADSSVRTHRARHAAAGAVIGAVLAAAAAESCFAQANFRAAFVAHNGNLEGSVSSVRIEADGTMTVIDRVITGATTSGGFDPGTNAYSMGISPNGRFLAVGHATSSSTFERLSMIEVHADGTLSLFSTYQVPDSPLDLLWIDDTHVAVTRTSLGGTNHARIYHFDEQANQFTFVDEGATGAFTTSLALSPNAAYLHANDSTGNQVTSFEVAANGTLMPLGSTGTSGTYPLGINVNRAGTTLYGGGGISNGGNKIVGLSIEPTIGYTFPMFAAPFVSPGASPKLAVTSSDDRFLFVAHGTDATCRVMSIDNPGKAPVDTGFMFDVGFQGTLGSMEVVDDLLLITDNSTIFDGFKGLYSFTVQEDGSLVQNGPILDTLGIAPNAIAVWSPDVTTTPGDLNDDGIVDFADLLILLSDWGMCPTPPATCDADLDGDGEVTFADLLLLLNNWS